MVFIYSRQKGAWILKASSNLDNCRLCQGGRAALQRRV